MTRSVLAVLAACTALSGCASLGADTTSSSQLAQAQATHEYPASSSPPQRADRSEANAVRALQVFASAYTNWNAQTVAADMRALAAASIGQARSSMELAAANAAHDYELRRGGIANSGTVEAVAPLQRSAHRYVVVTRELTTAANTTAYQGLRPAWHVTVATVTALAPGAWVVSGWQPES